MKKWMILVVGVLFFPVVSMAQSNSYLYEGDISFGKIIQKIQRNERLPLYFGRAHTFGDKNEKARAVAEVKKQLQVRPNHYWTHYNAAIVYSAQNSFEGFDTEAYLSERDFANAVLHADKAINLCGNNKTQAVYMYLLRANVKYMTSVRFGVYNGAYLINNSLEGRAREALKDYQQVERIDRNLANYSNMEDLAKILKMNELARKYGAIALAQQKRMEEQIRQKNAQMAAYQRRLRGEMKKVLNNFNKPFFGIF